jgi:hypothetical protein
MDFGHFARFCRTINSSINKLIHSRLQHHLLLNAKKKQSSARLFVHPPREASSVSFENT